MYSLYDNDLNKYPCTGQNKDTKEEVIDCALSLLEPDLTEDCIKALPTMSLQEKEDILCQFSYTIEEIDEKYDYYVLKMYGCVEAIFVGPFDTEDEAQTRCDEYREDPNECQNAHTTFKITKGAEIA